jgi:predicted enzyme related to lactoylglutathione lyase
VVLTARLWDSAAAGAGEKAEHAMSSLLHNITVDCGDPERAARFWAAVTGWPASREWEDEYAVSPGDGHRPKLYFVPVPEPKTVKNRVHLDIVPDDRSQDEELTRLLGLGATVVSDQRPDVGWVIMADPEGNEFCLEKSLAERAADEDT